MLKESFKQALIDYMQARLKVAKDAASQAKSAATDSESAAETKWDTFGLENSYLAHGQSVRVAECQRDLRYFSALTLASMDSITQGSVFLLEREDGWRKVIVMAQYVGGGEFDYEQQSVLIVTPESPLGRSLLGKEEGEEVSLKSRGETLTGEVVTIFFQES
ncbi:GreA/GreB family elongation factor [Marinomonas ostreistagni]|uniref:GreA/GreB family elongation factor n=1 Tax=Marinomonas ostreistagni TaxID=359209 RepID=UPI001951F64F|nr:GreA/GreB family elongation factor [Marinomonas ostreistagni]MBM6549963.1 GreA/GreB family elongation factor [Marinomonas ostreistagni]